MSQYGHGDVQKSNASSDAPMGVSRATDRTNVPFARYPFQRAMVRSRCSGAGPRGRAEESRSAAKSGGVTSDTNHGIDFGLQEVGQRTSSFVRGWERANWNTTLDTYGVWDTRKSAKTRSVKSCGDWIDNDCMARGGVRLTSKPAFQWTCRRLVRWGCEGHMGQAYHYPARNQCGRLSKSLCAAMRRPDRP